MKAKAPTGETIKDVDGTPVVVGDFVRILNDDGKLAPSVDIPNDDCVRKIKAVVGAHHVSVERRSPWEGTMVHHTLIRKITRQQRRRQIIAFRKKNDLCLACGLPMKTGVLHPFQECEDAARGKVRVMVPDLG